MGYNGIAVGMGSGRVGWGGVGSTVIGWMPLDSACQGSPALEEATLRWIENSLGVPVWVPVHPLLYEQFGAAVSSAVDSFNNPARREAALGLVDSRYSPIP